MLRVTWTCHKRGILEKTDVFLPQRIPDALYLWLSVKVRARVRARVRVRVRVRLKMRFRVIVQDRVWKLKSIDQDEAAKSAGEESWGEFCGWGQVYG